LLLSFGQQRLWFLAQMHGASEAYHIQESYRLRGVLDEVALRRALDRLVVRHESLRTTFTSVDGEPVQRIAAENAGFSLVRHDLVGDCDAQGRLQELLEEQARRTYDLQAGPLIRGCLVRLGQHEHVLLIAMHHIISDGWSMGVLIRELSALYGSYCRGEPDMLEPLPVQYADYAAWQRRWLSGEVLTRQSAYWREVLAGTATLLDLPTDHKRPAQQDYRGDSVDLRLDETLTNGLKMLSRRCGVTLFMTVLAGWALVLARLSGQNDVVIGVPSANRRRSELEGLVGFFVNTLALRIDLSGEPSIEELLRRVRSVALGAQEHQDLPFEQVVELVGPRRSLAHAPIFQVMFAWQNNEPYTLDFREVAVEALPTPLARTKFDLVLNLSESDGCVLGRLEYAAALNERESVERHGGYLRRVLAEFARSTVLSVPAVPLLGEAERNQLLVQWNETAAAYPHDRCIHELFEERVRDGTAAAAVVYEERTVSYGELNTRANRLAHHLRSLGVGPDVRVAICVERSVEMVVGLLGILKAGGAYVPLDPAYPAERLAFMLKDSTPAVVLTHPPARAPLDAALGSGAGPLKVVDLMEDAQRWMEHPASDPDPAEVGLRSAHLAYVIYTSGSTGQPKGVVVEHSNLVASTVARRTFYGCYGRFLLLSSFAFDSSVAGIFGTLTSGGTLVMLAADVLRDVTSLHETVRRQRIESLLCVPSLYFALLAMATATDGQEHTLSRVIVAGEVFPTGLLRAWKELPYECQLFNEYGPTEGTVWASCFRCDRSSTHSRVPIGRPIANTRIYILDEHLEPVPRGVVGEIYIAGASVARGYLNRPELTAQRFIANPFVSGDRLYRTGDLGRYLADGNIEFLGRNDFQVKIRGFRIELGEIEARLLEYPQVREAVVLAREAGPWADGERAGRAQPDGPGDWSRGSGDVPSGEKRLVGYYTAQPGMEPEVSALRQHLSAVLPEYMVPAAYVRLDTMPLTPNGKLDRKALPAPDAEAYGPREYEPPVGKVEVALARIWEEVLRLERVGRHDNFFDLGGHSLLAMRVLERMRREGLHANVSVLFAAPTLSGLSAQASFSRDVVEVPPSLIPVGCQEIRPEHLPLVSLTQQEIDQIVSTVAGGASNVQDIYPLAPLQEGILFHHLMAHKGDPYVVWSFMSFADRGCLDAYVRALEAVIARHDILRTAVVWEGVRDPVQVVWRQAPLVVEEVRLDAADGDIAEQLRMRFSPRCLRLDVRQAPLMRLFAAYDPLRGEWLLMELAHHLSTDHTALEEMQAQVQSELLLRPDRLPRPVPFRNFLSQLKMRKSEHVAFFRRMLAQTTVPTAPFGILDTRGDGTRITQATRAIEPNLARSLRRRARALRVSAATLFHVAWARVLAQTSASRDPVFGTVLFGRMRGGEGADRALGLFMNTLPVRVRLDGVTAARSVYETHQTLARLLQHESAPLAVAQRCSSLPANVPLFTALLNYRHTTPVSPLDDESARAWSGIKRIASEERTNYPVALFVDDVGDEFGLTAQTMEPIDPSRICDLMHGALSNLSNQLESSPPLASAGSSSHRYPGDGPQDDHGVLTDEGLKVVGMRLVGQPRVREYEPPMGTVEVMLARIWAEVLGLERVGRHDDFFDLGGHSLLAVRVLERMRREGLDVDLSMLFLKPTIALNAQVIRARGQALCPAVSVGSPSDVPGLLA
jgi:amino acid adenylation domain-containing protein